MNQLSAFEHDSVSRSCSRRVSVDEMLPGIQNDGQLNGQFVEYEDSFTANNNEIYGFKTFRKLFCQWFGNHSSDSEISTIQIYYFENLTLAGMVVLS